MFSPSDFRKGLRILVDDQPYYVVEYQHFKMGRGKANIRTKLKHIKTRHSSHHKHNSKLKNNPDNGYPHLPLHILLSLMLQACYRK
jgi:translation elongation factor P/translation initiation factor 5A